MTQSQELRIRHDELTRVSFDCPTCRAELTVDLMNSTQTDRFRAYPGVVGDAFRCHFCGKAFDVSIRQAVNDLCEFLKHMREAEQPATFRIQQPPAESPAKSN